MTAHADRPALPVLEDLAGRLEKRLREPLPGPAAQLRMIPEPRPGHRSYQDVEADCPKAGVLIMLYPLDGRPYLLLTRRTDRLLHHRGQISFPGGAWDPPETLRETAIREAREELGVALDGLRVLGDLTPLYIPPSHFCVYPATAVLPERPPVFQPQPDEVAEIIETPLDRLLDAATRRRETWTLAGESLTVPFFDVRGHKIWGATAMILAEFLALFEALDAVGPVTGLDSAGS